MAFCISSKLPSLMHATVLSEKIRTRASATQRQAAHPILLTAERLQYFSIQGGRAPAVWMDAITRFGSPSDAAYFENREPLRDERRTRSEKLISPRSA